MLHFENISYAYRFAGVSPSRASAGPWLSQEGLKGLIRTTIPIKGGSTISQQLCLGRCSDLARTFGLIRSQPPASATGLIETHPSVSKLRGGLRRLHAWLMSRGRLSWALFLPGHPGPVCPTSGFQKHCLGNLGWLSRLTARSLVLICGALVVSIRIRPSENWSVDVGRSENTSTNRCSPAPCLVFRRKRYGKPSGLSSSPKGRHTTRTVILLGGGNAAVREAQRVKAGKLRPQQADQKPLFEQPRPLTIAKSVMAA